MDRLEEIIELHILPLFGSKDSELQSLATDLYNLCAYHLFFARQIIESPGRFEKGQMWFSVSSIVHSYYFCPDRNETYGRQIWKKQEFILDTNSLLDKDQRSDFIQALEPGEFISIRYTDVYWMMENNPTLRKQLDQLVRSQQRYYRQRIQLLNQPPLERVRQFEAENALFARIASNSIKASHVSLTRQGYETILRKLETI